MIALDDICRVLGVSKPTASLLRSGQYPAEDGRLAEQYQALERVVSAARGADASELCLECPRDDCSGCRIFELQTQNLNQEEV